MKQFLTIATVVILFCCGTSAMAFNWNFHDFGPTPFDGNNNTAPIYYPSCGFLPSPGLAGEGGERYDLEGLFVATDNDYMYVALTNSFGLSSVSGQGHTFRMGDIFFGQADNPNRFAIDVSAGKLMEVDSWNWIQNENDSYFGYTAIRDRVGAHEWNTGTELATIDNKLTLWEDLETNPLLPGNGDTWVFEWKFDRSLLGGWNGASDLFFHATMGCGNDVIETPYTAIPEPGTMILLGIGLFGTGLITRRK